MSIEEQISYLEADAGSQFEDFKENSDRDFWQGERLETEYLNTEEDEFGEVRGELIEYTMYWFSLSLFLSVLSISEVLGFAWYYGLVLLMIYEGSLILYNVHLLTQFSQKNRKINTIVGSSSCILFYVLQIIYWEEKSLPFMATLIPLMIGSVVRLFFKNYSLHGCQTFSLIVGFFARWIKLLTLTTIAVRLDFDLDWSWFAIFWAVWGGILILVIVFLASLLLILVDITLYLCKGKENAGEIATNFWIFAGTGGASSVFAYLFYSICTQSALFFPALVSSVFLILFIILTVYCYATLLKWWEAFFANDDNFPMPQAPLPLPPGQLQLMNNHISGVLRIPPKILVRLSSTYYMPADNKITPGNRRSLSLADCKRKEKIEHKRTISGLPASPYQDKCKVCCSRPSNAVVMDCGHGGICYTCATLLWDGTRKCHMCRSYIVQLLKVQPEDFQTVNVISASNNF